MILTIFSLQVLYNILDWPTKPHSNLVVVGIHLSMVASSWLLVMELRQFQ